MFTGLVREVGKVASFEDGRLVVESATAAELGDSVAIDGVCLTVVEASSGLLAFDVVPETLARVKSFGDRVNVESALRAGDPLGGHQVQGHVDGIGRVASVTPEGEGVRIRIEAPSELLRYCVEKGSITVDGVSLTVAEVDETGFEVALIPHTLEVTTLGELTAGDAGQPGGRRPRQVRRKAAPRYDATVTMAADPRTESPFATVEEAIEEIRAGRFVVVVDDEDRENEGDLTIAAQFATPEAVNFMATHGRGLICLCLTEERCDELGLRQMTEQNETPFGTAFTVSIEAREGVTTGISAHDRARTIQVAIDPEAGPRDLVQPGHVFPLRARRGGVLQRAGQTEAAVDLARLAGLIPGGRRLRDHERRRHDGPRARPDRVLRARTG